MDKKYIDENEIEIKYLRNQLTTEELEEFEVFLIDNPELVEQLELDSTLLNGLEVLKQNVKKPKPIFHKIFSFDMLPIMASFMSGLLVVVLFQSWFGENKTAEILSSTQIEYLSGFRSASNTTTPEITIYLDSLDLELASKKRFVLSLDTNVEGGFSYVVEFYRVQSDQSNSINIDKIKGAISDNEGSIGVVLKTNKYPPGKYEVRLVASNDDFDNTHSFYFRTMLNDKNIETLSK